MQISLIYISTLSLVSCNSKAIEKRGLKWGVLKNINGMRWKMKQGLKLRDESHEN